ncbi:alpha/beta hydrolase [Flavobacterium hungaricum]|uniref:Alpha/beta hydrolase n=1 Tax=Flavobacterium hungaricum TaxID=2082725 RepID=A0ABR9TE69_9FLAO|nr:alpha/beta hydrolase-fold protein [Flavobacterium hungaricum]MBE8723565.1 alpha/beta hydrolase [Flavobacterium hungaricum]
MQRIFMLFLVLITYIGKAQESTASKNVAAFTIEAPQLKTSKKIWIYLPQNYSTESKKRYSVVYMQDAQNLFDAKTSYSGEWNVDEKLDSLKAPVIVVGIEHGNDKRIAELTPFKNEKYGDGNADNYLEFIVQTLKPYVDKNYRTKTKAKNTTIMGSSLGGLVSFYGALKYPDVFGKAGVFSPSFWFSNEIYAFAEKQSKVKTKIYFLCGDKESGDMVKDLHRMERLLDTKRCYCLHLTKSKIVKGGEHNEKLWRDEFVKAILWLGY